MNDVRRDPDFRSPLAELIRQHIAEKRACGCLYRVECQGLRAFDAYLCEIRHASPDLPKEVVEGWTARRLHEKSRNQQNRASVVRGLVRFLLRHGIAAHPPDVRGRMHTQESFTPFIFTGEQISALLAAADRIRACAVAPDRQFVVPEIMRLLCCCGMRHGEVRRLRNADVDVAQGVVVVLDGKFGKDRLVPLPEALQVRLHRYAQRLGTRPPTGPFFPGPYGHPYSTGGLYRIFRCLLRECGIAHGGRGRGPRLHDIRHSFAVHRLERWYREGIDLSAKLPVLAAYMGHKSIRETQLYLRLTPHLFPDVCARMEQHLGHVIPRRPTS